MVKKAAKKAAKRARSTTRAAARSTGKTIAEAERPAPNGGEDAAEFDPFAAEGLQTMLEVIPPMSDEQFLAFLAALLHGGRTSGQGLSESLALAKNLVALVKADSEAEAEKDEDEG